LAGVLALHSRQGAHGGRLEKWGFRVLLVGTVLGTVGSFGEYYTPNLEFFFVAFAPPGFLLMMFGSLLFGIGTLRARMAPRLGGWLLTIGGFPGIVVMTVLVGHLSGGLLLLDFAWVVLGYALWRKRGGLAEHSPRVR
jgi:peptidoglycan/LPS O-acetylase OafA/YrhL